MGAAFEVTDELVEIAAEASYREIGKTSNTNQHWEHAIPADKELERRYARAALLATSRHLEAEDA